MHAVRDGFGYLVAASDFDQHRRLEHGVGEALDFFRESGREEQALSLLRQHVEDAGDIGDETHVEHPVGFVEDQRLHRVEADALVLDVVEQAAGGGDEDLDTLFEFGDLWLDVHAAESAHGTNRRVLAVGLDRFVDLQRQFAGRCEDQRAHRMPGRRRAAAGERQDALQDRQHEGRGLAGAGLGAAHDVHPADQQRYGLGLDRCWFGVTFVENRAQQFGGEAEVRESDFGSSFRR